MRSLLIQLLYAVMGFCKPVKAVQKERNRAWGQRKTTVSSSIRAERLSSWGAAEEQLRARSLRRVSISSRWRWETVAIRTQSAPENNTFWQAFSYLCSLHSSALTSLKNMGEYYKQKKTTFQTGTLIVHRKSKKKQKKRTATGLKPLKTTPVSFTRWENWAESWISPVWNLICRLRCGRQHWDSSGSTGAWSCRFWVCSATRGCRCHSKTLEDTPCLERRQTEKLLMHERSSSAVRGLDHIFIYYNHIEGTRRASPCDHMWRLAAIWYKLTCKTMTLLS